MTIRFSGPATPACSVQKVNTFHVFIPYGLDEITLQSASDLIITLKTDALFGKDE
jgi:hypothetical protein